MYKKKVHHLNSIRLEYPEDCGKGIAFWVNQQVGTFLDSLSFRWNKPSYLNYEEDWPNKKASDCAKGDMYVAEYGEHVLQPCGHTEWKKTSSTYIKYYHFHDYFALTDLDKIQNPYEFDKVGNPIINGYIDNLCNLLSVSGVYTKVQMDFQTYLISPAGTVKDCSYRDNGKHKVVTIEYSAHYSGKYNYVSFGTLSREINAPVPVATAA